MNKTALSIIISIILTIIIVSLVNVGTSLFLKEPQYEKFCNHTKSIALENSENLTKDVCESYNGTWTPQNIQCIKAPCPQGYCDFYQKCSQEFSDAQKPYNQKKFYVFAFLGFILLIFGLFVSEMLLQITSLASGGILVFEGIVTNLQDKLIVFISLLAILVIFGIIAYRVIKYSKKK